MARSEFWWSIKLFRYISIPYCESIQSSVSFGPILTISFDQFCARIECLAVAQSVGSFGKNMICSILIKDCTLHRYESDVCHENRDYCNSSKSHNVVIAKRRQNLCSAGGTRAEILHTTAGTGAINPKFQIYFSIISLSLEFFVYVISGMGYPNHEDSISYSCDADACLLSYFVYLYVEHRVSTQSNLHSWRAFLLRFSLFLKHDQNSQVIRCIDWNILCRIQSVWNLTRHGMW